MASVVEQLVDDQSISDDSSDDESSSVFEYEKYVSARRNLEIRESSFNMTRGGGDEDIETRSLKF